MGDLSHQWGFAEESTYGTDATPATFLPFLSETMGRQQRTVRPEGIRPGSRFNQPQQAISTHHAEGGVTSEVYTTGMGLLLKHLLGAVSTSQPDVPNSPTVYEHVFTPGALAGKGLTLQKGVDIEGGAAVPYTYPGTKVRGANFSVGVDGVLQCAWDFVSQQEKTGTALAAASYASGLKVFHWGQGTVKKDDVAIGTVTAVNGLQIVNALRIPFNMGNSGLMSEPQNQPNDTISGSFTMEFAGNADVYDLWTALTEFELELEFVGDVISDDETELFRIELAAAQIMGDTPQISGREIVELTVPFEAYTPASGDAVTITYQNTDTSY